MVDSFLTGIHLRGEVTYQEAARRLAGALGVFHRHGLTPATYTGDAWKEAGQLVFGGTSLTHQEYAALAKDPLWGAGFMLVPAPESSATVLTMNTPAVLEGGPSPWRWLLPLAEEVAEGLGADIAMANGFSSRRGRGGNAAGREVAPGHPPGVLGPWMYWSAGRLAEDGLETARMAKFPAARSSASAGGGWVLQAHQEYSGKKPVDLLQACAKAWKV